MILDHSLIHDIKAIIISAKEKAVRAVDHERTLLYWHIGRRIFEEEQQGKTVQNMEIISQNLYLNN
jgi:hypothetical protein